MKLFVTGGTFDKKYDPALGQLSFTETHINEMLKKARIKIPLEIEVLMLVDSLDMTEEQRKLIVEKCRLCPDSQIIITHGTDTMVNTAKALSALSNQKTIILTGSMVPYSLAGSDAFFNLGTAIAFAQTLPQGIYIVAHGKAFPWDKVKKNGEAAAFEEIK
jgi:L-asparaginase